MGYVRSPEYGHIYVISGHADGIQPNELSCVK